MDTAYTEGLFGEWQTGATDGHIPMRPLYTSNCRSSGREQIQNIFLFTF